MKQRNKKITERRKRRVLSGIIAVVLVAAMGLGMFLNFETKVQAAPNTVVDPDTTNNWSSIAASSNSTENIGRIWTDKSVFNKNYDFEGALAGTSVTKGENADFMVGLSAMSSTSNLKSTVTNTTPLDIVLVLDVSGSMDNSIGETETTTYQEVYDSRYWGLDTRMMYYVRSGNDYIAVSWEGGYYGSWQDQEGNEYEPRTSQNDHNSNHVQFYRQITESESAGSKIDALKEAANGFAETFATMNDGITDTSKQHRISVVKFSGNSSDQIGNDTYSYDGNTYNYSQVVSDLSSYTTQTVSNLESTINSLNPAGSTRADYGLSQAERVLSGARQGAQKVVIFFTDGEPNGFSGWDGEVAANAINTAHGLKQSGTLVYTIGVFEDADPSDTRGNFNRYMNAVSSNYPEAECVNRRGQQSSSFGDLNLGNKVAGEEGEEAPQYYYSATNAVGLEQVFKEITESLPINEGSGSPIEEQQGAAGTPGVLTFTDTLGSYMEVTGVGEQNDTMYLAFADGLHEGTTSDGGKTWEFSGVVNTGGVNEAYPDGADLSQITVEVTKSNALATGDIITVEIPASLIPMRHYDVDTDNSTMTVSNTYPIRLFYGVSLKEAAEAALENPQDENYAALVESQTSGDGKTIDFYSNNFTKKAKEGTTEATFTPSDGNKFYYYPVNTQLFTNKDCTQPATRNNIGNYSTLYYKDSYWQLTGTSNEAEEVSVPGSITRSGNDWNVTYRDGYVYIAENTPRADRPATLVSNKSQNLTGTASTVLTPTWVGTNVSQKLGNNGKLSFPAPGELEIKKTVNWGNASEETKTDKNSFKFTVHLYTEGEDGTKTNLTGKYPYAIYETGEDLIENGTGTISDNREITLKDGQRVVISDLPDGAKFTVEEQGANENGFTTTDSYANAAEGSATDDGKVEGTIVGGSKESVAFTNSYHAEEVRLGTEQAIKVQKNLTGREWQDTDEFRFTMKAEGNAPAPESTDAVVVDDEDEGTNYTVALSNITFNNPGKYTYVIEEDNDTNPIAGIDYSNETYAVTITVEDDGAGKLEIADIAFEQRRDIDGNESAEQPEIQDNTVVFTNQYNAEKATTNLNGIKDYTDNSGANPNAKDKFTFELKAIGGYATNGGSAQNPTISAADVPMPEGADAGTHTITIGNNGTTPDDSFAFQTITYTGDHLNNTYIYEIREIIPQGASDNRDGTWSLNGMTYDGTVHTITVAVSDAENTQGEGMHIVATPSMQPADVEFTNVYDPTDITISDDTKDAIHGTKVLQGREIGDNETFYFQLTQTGGPETVLKAPETKTVTKAGGMDFIFSDMTFSKVGKYTFTVNEVADDQGTETKDGSGMTYSQNVAEVTVNVTDKRDGTLAAEVTYENQGSDDTTKAVFTNIYKASMNYGAQGKGGIHVTKQLLDRPMTAGEFDFTITGEDDAADLTAKADKSFQNKAAAADETITMEKLQSLTFDETDAGKTYTFIVDEADPAVGEALPQIVYDQSQYKVEIEVVDNGDGNMHTVTTVTKTVNEEGNEIADGGQMVVDHANSDAEAYAIPTFGFVNDYDPNSVSIGEDTDNALQVTKKVIGAPSTADYTFTLTAVDTAAGPIANITGLDENHKTTETTQGTIAAGETQTLSFDTLTFTEPGTYTFTVQENQPVEDAGWTFDTTTRTITVEVTDINPDYEPGGEEPQYDGNLYIGKVTGNNPTIENKYDHGTDTIGGDTDTPLQVTKKVVGWETGAEFSFTLTPVEAEGVDWSTVQYKKEALQAGVTEHFNAGDTKDAKFGEFTFTEPGTYEFQVAEDQKQADAPAGWTYDDHTYTITVEVKETNADGEYDGELHAAVTSAPVTFENKYHASAGEIEGTASFKGTKIIEGRNGLENETFGFTLTKGSVEDDADWSAVTYQAAGADEAAAFESADAVAEMSTENDTKAFAFDGIFTFTKTGTYTFNVTETQHNGEALPDQADEPVNGMTYDRHVGVITVEVSDNGSGTLQTNVTYGDVTEGADENDMTFENAYEPTPVVYGDDVAEILGGNKNVDDNSGSYVMADDQFTFMMRAQNKDNPMPKGLTPTYDNEGRPIVSVTNKNTNAQNNTATFDFGEIKFTKAGIYRYNIYENETNMPAGVSPQNSGRTYTIRFVVEEDQTTGTLSVEASAVLIGAGDQENTKVGLDEINFTNVYNATATSGSTQIFKTMSGRNWQQGDTFTFDVKMTVDGVAADEMPTFNFDNTGATVKDFTSEAGKLSYNITITPSTSETGNTYPFSTGTATYTHEGTYVYTITERDVDPSIVNVTKDPKTYTVTVTVTNVNNVLQRKVDINPATESGRVDFTNTFVPTAFEDVPEGFEFTKEFTGHEWTEDYSFDFVLKAVDGAPMPADAVDGAKTVMVKSPDAEDGTTAAFNFGDIKYEKAGTYKYTVNEVVPEEGTEDYNAGITYDSHIANVTVTVTEDEDENGNKTGTLSAEAVITAEDDDTPEVFTNTYDTNEVTIGGDDSTGIAVQKTLAGRDWEAGDGFDFQIEAVTEDAPMPEETTITGLGNTSGSDAVVAYFGDITFTKEMLNGASTKEFKYTVSETSVSADGVTVDPSTERTVTVTVTDDGKGTLTATVKHDNSNATTDADKQVTNAAAFTNTYDAASTGDKVPAGFTLTKEFTGHEWTKDYAFEFIMSPVSGKLADGTEVAVAEIPMPKADDNAGVTVGENGNAHKTISGPQKGTTANFDFGTITYDKAGTYVYQVKEAKAGDTDKGVTYSNSTATITVTVTDKDASGVSTGKLVATASIEGDTFTNTYEANADYNAQGAGGLDITKQLNNRNMTADQFTFTIEATGDKAADAAKKLGITDGMTTTVKNAAGNAGEAKSVVANPFENMTFDETDDGVTYTYTIKEEGKSGEDGYAGYTLDDTTYTVSITAIDDGDGTMTVKTVVNDGTADKEYTDQRATIAFENTYKAGDVTVGAKGDAQIVANKTLKNDDIANYAGKFNFQVTSGKVVVAEGTNDRNGNITFGDITYTTENLAAAVTAGGSEKVGKASLDNSGDVDVYTFNYSVSEVITGLPGGVSYNSGNTNVTVKVTDDRHGKLDVEVGYKDGATSVEFVNTYGEDGKAELNLKGNKKIVPGEGLTEAPALVDDTYTFEITGNAAEDGTRAPMPAETTATNKSGAVEFGPITFTMENVFGTTPTTQDVTVEEEQTTEETTVEGETTPAEGEAEAVAGEEAAVTEGEETTEGETVTAGVTNADEGIELQTAGRKKTFTYTIKETEGSVPGVDNDTTVKTVTVTVTDEGDGKISVKAAPDESADTGNDFTFTNVYNVDPKDSSLTGDGGFKITKTLTGRDMAQGEFAFRLKEQNGDWWTAPTNPAAADGEAAEITFGAVHFTKPGTYTYTLEEEQGNLAGVEYDSNKYTVIATVTDKDADDNYTGKLEVTWQINGAADNIVAFKNTYTADPTSVSLGAGKLIKGRDLKAGEFSFLLSDADGKEIDTAKNEENGAVTFKTITFDEAGTYSYEIREVLPEDDDSKTDGIQSGNVTYDENIYHVTVDVKDNTEKGCLEATVTYEDSDGAPVFVNTYIEPKKETPAGNDGGGTILGVKTGDVAEILPLLIVMAAAIVVIIAMSVILIRRRRR